MLKIGNTNQSYDINNNKYKLFKNNKFIQQNTNINNLINDIIKIINTTSIINSKLIDEQLYYYIQNNELLISHIDLILGNICKIYIKEIYEIIKQNKLNLNYIVNIWNRYTKKINKLHNILWYFNKKYEPLYLYKIMYEYFLKNIIDIKYNDVDISIYLIDSLSNINIQNVISFFLIAKTYKKYEINHNIFYSIFQTLNSCQVYCTSLLKFIDINIRYLSKNYDEEIYKTLMNSLYLIKDNNMFYTHYVNYLSTRLLTNMSNINLELSFVEKLDTKYTFKIKKLIQDILDSVILNKLYSKLIFEIQSEKYKNIIVVPNMLSRFKANILNTFYWNNIENVNNQIIPPVEAEMYTDVYYKFYIGKYPNRNIYWQHNIGKSVIAFKGKDKTYNLHLSTLQMFVIMYLNDGIDTVHQISDKSNINPKVIQYLLDCFVDSEIIYPEYDIVTHYTIYKFNDDFIFQTTDINLMNYMNNMPKLEVKQMVVEASPIIKEEKQMVVEASPIIPDIKEEKDNYIDKIIQTLESKMSNILMNSVDIKEINSKYLLIESLYNSIIIVCSNKNILNDDKLMVQINQKIININKYLKEIKISLNTGIDTINIEDLNGSLKMIFCHVKAVLEMLKIYSNKQKKINVTSHEINKYMKHLLSSNPIAENKLIDLLCIKYNSISKNEMKTVILHNKIKYDNFTIYDNNGIITYKFFDIYQNIVDNKNNIANDIMNIMTEHVSISEEQLFDILLNKYKNMKVQIMQEIVYQELSNKIKIINSPSNRIYKLKID
jgi:hypothetical protein